ncbi:MAG: hypothetical protein ACFLMY_15570 [Candidatus Brachytrichaceae bacterium NZ_4S206]|jgi:hypothetical protein
MLAQLITQPAHANVGPPMRGGDLAAEPIGLQDIDVVHEVLEIDLRPLEQAQPARIVAAYTLNNRGQAREVELMFVTSSQRAGSFAVTLNDSEYIQPDIQQIKRDALPVKWQPPEVAPGLDGVPVDLPLFNYAEIVVALFKPVIPASQSTLTVRYEAEAVRYMRSGTPTDQWLLAYSLAPAASWASFGQLKVTVLTPPKWLIASEPALARNGDVLTGEFNGLPADAIALTTRAPESATYTIVAFVLTASLFVVLVGGLFTVLRVSWLRGSAGRGVGLAALGFASLWAVLVLAIGLAGVFIPPLLLPPLQVGDYGYLRILVAIGVGLLALLALLVGWPAGVIAGSIARKRSNPSSPAGGR